MESTSAQAIPQTLTDEERAHSRQALLLLCLCAAVILLSVILAIGKADPRGVYVCAYEITADGDRESGRNAELHLKSGGVATYVSRVGADADADIKMNGSWERDGSKIILIFQGEKAVFHRSGNKLIEKLENGGQVVYIKD